MQVLSSIELQYPLVLTTFLSHADSNLEDDDDDKSLPDIPEGEEDVEAPPAKRHQKSGQLDPQTNGHAPVAMPDNYPEEWKKKFAAGYQQTAETIDQVDTHSRANSGKATPPPERTQERRSKQDTGNALPHADTHASGGVAAEHVTADEAAEDEQLRKSSKGSKRTVNAKGSGYAILDDGIENGQPNSRRRTSDSECSIVTPFAATSLERAPTVVSLSQIDPEVLADASGVPRPIGLDGTDPPSGFERAESVGSEHDYMTLGPDGVPTAGLLQAGMNEPSGALGAPSELSLQHTTYSGKVRNLLLGHRSCHSACLLCTGRCSVRGNLPVTAAAAAEHSSVLSSIIVIITCFPIGLQGLPRYVQAKAIYCKLCVSNSVPSCATFA